jgi:hypothetical protein
MNKRNTIKLTGITLVASMAVGLWASAVAAPNNDQKGPKASIRVQSLCTVDNTDPSNALLVVTTTITDASSAGGINAEVTDNTVEVVLGIGSNMGGRKNGGSKWQPTGIMQDGVTGPVGAGLVSEVTLPLCADGRTNEANNANAVITIDIVGGHKTWVSMCDDNPATEEVEAGVPISGLGLCP